YDFPLKRPPQHGFMTLDTSPVHIIGEPVSIRFDVRRQNQRVGENLFQCLWSQDYRSVPPTARRAYGRDNEWILRLGRGLRQGKKRCRGRSPDAVYRCSRRGKRASSAGCFYGTPITRMSDPAATATYCLPPAR